MPHANLQKQHTGRMAFHAGIAAEQSVERHYAALGFDILGRRWRGISGEIDLIVRNSECFVFVEVKKSSSFARAAGRVSKAQQRRIFATATEFICQQPAGMLSNMRFDVALLDNTGAIEILVNALHCD